MGGTEIIPVQKSASRRSTENKSIAKGRGGSDLREARFWIVSGLPTNRTQPLFPASQKPVSGPRDKLYGVRGYFDIARLGGYYCPARGQRNQEKVILCFQGYFLISAGQFCTRVKGWFSSFTSPVLMRNFLPSAVTV